MIETNRIELVPVSGTDSGKMMDELEAESCCWDSSLQEPYICVEHETMPCGELEKVRVLMVAVYEPRG